MNAWKKCDRFLSVLCWVVLGVEVVYALARLVLPTGTLVGVDRVAMWLMPVLLAGAVGYVTNWLALWYLFKPYEPHWGGCVQGIIPRQKKEMARSMGRMVGEKLLNPDALVNELKNEVSGFVADPARRIQLREALQRYLLANEDAIVGFVTPYVERQLVDVFDSLATEETWGKIWDEGILPRLKNEAARKFLVEKFVTALRENANGMIEELRGELRSFLQTKISENPFFGMFAGMITDFVMNNLATSENLKAKLEGWLTRESTQELLRTKLLEYADHITDWMRSGEGQRVLGGVIHELKVRGRRFVATYIREKVPVLIDQAFASETLRDRLDNEILPRVGAKLVQLIGENREVILEKLRLQDRVAEAVDKMSVKDFHMTLNDFMAENFCAVQVLGFILGALVGALQLLAKV